MKNLKNLNATTMIALSLLLSTGVSSLNIDNFGQIVNISHASEGRPGYVKTQDAKGKLNVRSGPGTNNSIKAKLDNGLPVSILGESGAWLEVHCTEGGRNVKGWVARSYISETEGGEVITAKGTPLAAGTKGTVVNVTSSLTVRRDTSVSSAKLGSLKPNEKVEVTHYTENWRKIKKGDFTGWVSRAYLYVPALDSKVANVDNNNNNNSNNNSGGASNTGGGTNEASKATDAANPPVNKMSDTTKYIKGDTVNIRTQPSKDSSYIKTQYTKGKKITVDAITKDTLYGYRWYRIKGENLWVADEFVSNTNPNEEGAGSNGAGSNGTGSTDQIKAKSIKEIDVKTKKACKAYAKPWTTSANFTYAQGTTLKIYQQSEQKDGIWYKIKDDAGAWIKASDVVELGVGKVESINERVKMNNEVSQGYTDITKGYTKKSFSLKKSYVYQANKKVKVSGSEYYYVKALNSNNHAWISAKDLTVVTKRTNIGGKATKVTVINKPYMFTNTQFTKKVDPFYRIANNTVVKVNNASSVGVNVTVTVPGNLNTKKTGWINKGFIKYYSAQSVHSDSIESVTLKELFNDVYATEKEKQNESVQALADNENTVVITGAAGKPYMAQIDVCVDGSEPYYLEQYVVDITSKDGTVKTLRFDHTDFNLMKSIYSGQEVTLYADATTTNEDGTIPMMIVGADFTDLNSDAISYSHLAPLTDTEIVTIMAEDFKEFLSSYGITVEEFSQEDIEAIVKQINTAKVDEDTVTIGGSEEDSVGGEVVEVENKKDKTSLMFEGMKSKF